MLILLEYAILLFGKKVKISNESNIRNGTELVVEFGRLVAETTRVEGLRFYPRSHPEQAVIELDGRELVFPIHYDPAPSPKKVEALVADGGSPILLVVPNITSRLLAACRKLRLSAADLNGRVFLRAQGLWVEQPALSGRRFKFESEPRNIFVGKSARIVRALLADPDRVWKQAEMVDRAGATSGLVSRIISYLERQNFLTRSGASKRDQTFQLTARDDLLDAWAQADHFARRVSTYHFHSLEQDPMQLARKLRKTLTHSGAHFAFTQWIAAWLRHPYTEPQLVSLYVPHLPAQNILDSLGLRPVSDGGRVLFHVPVDEGVFRETRIVDNLPLVSDAQIYLDLQNTGLRGPEQARALRESPVFCRP